MTEPQDDVRVVSASLRVEAPAAAIFEHIADPARQIAWDGNANLAESAPGQRVHATGDVFATTTTSGVVRENHVAEFEEGRRIAWRPAEPGQPPIGQLWRWELTPDGDGRTTVTHTYDWTNLHDPNRIQRARNTGVPQLTASLENLKRLVEAEAG